MGTPKNWTPIAKKGALLSALVAAGAVGVGLTDKVDPVFPGVMFESKILLPLPGTYCSAGVPVATADGRLGFLIASRCTDPFWPGSYVYQPWFGPTTFAGYSTDWGTDNSYYEPDRRKPDAALWIVMGRGASNEVPLGYCGRTGSRDMVGVVPEASITSVSNIWKMGHVTRCTGTWSKSNIWPDTRYSGSVYSVPIEELNSDSGDSGGLVFTIGCYGRCGVNAVGIIIGGIPPGGPWRYVLVQSADYALRYYGARPYVG